MLRIVSSIRLISSPALPTNHTSPLVHILQRAGFFTCTGSVTDKKCLRSTPLSDSQEQRLTNFMETTPLFENIKNGEGRIYIVPPTFARQKFGICPTALSIQVRSIPNALGIAIKEVVSNLLKEILAGPSTTESQPTPLNLSAMVWTSRILSPLESKEVRFILENEKVQHLLKKISKLNALQVGQTYEIIIPAIFTTELGLPEIKVTIIGIPGDCEERLRVFFESKT